LVFSFGVAGGAAPALGVPGVEGIDALRPASLPFVVGAGSLPFVAGGGGFLPPPRPVRAR